MRISLRISNGKLAGREIPVRGPRFLIGCADDCHLKIPATQVSLYHCALLVQDDGIWVRNYGSGVSVSGTRIVDRRRLNDGDEVQVGLVRFEMLIHDAPAKRNDSGRDESKGEDTTQPVEGSVAPAPESKPPSNGTSESPEVPPAPGTTPDTQEVLDQVQQRRLEDMEPASEIATDTLLQYFTCRNAHDAPQAAPAPIAPKRKKPPWWMLVDQDGDVNPNVMFVLGILVGVGLSTAAHTFWMISGPPPDTVPTPAAIVDNAARATADEALTTESLTTADEEGEAPGEE